MDLRLKRDASISALSIVPAPSTTPRFSDINDCSTPANHSRYNSIKYISDLNKSALKSRRNTTRRTIPNFSTSKKSIGSNYSSVRSQVQPENQVPNIPPQILINDYPPQIFKGMGDQETLMMKRSHTSKSPVRQVL